MKTKKVLSLKDLTLFTVSAIILLDTLAATASIGVSSIFWWLLLGTIFMLPIGLITAELGTAIPAEGGIYVWIRRAFGERWAARASWAYWVNVSIWLPAIFVLFAGILSRLYGLDLTIMQQVMIGIGLAWLTASLDVVGLNVSKWVPDIGALLKLLIFGVLIIAGFRYAYTYGFAAEITASTLTPSWGNDLKYLPAVIYGMLGFELVSSAGDEIKDPKRNVPRAILISGLIILGLYTAATAGMLVAIPAGELDIVDGLIDTLFMLLKDVPMGDTIVYILGTAALFTFFSNGATWALGSNRAAAEAARDGQLPSIFSYQRTPDGGPAGAAIMMGIICSLVLLVYGAIAQDNADLFWSLFAFSAVIFMLPYIGMALAFMKLRATEPTLERPYRVPGSEMVGRLLGSLVTIILVISISMFIYVPEEGLSRETLIGFIVVMLVGEAMIRIGKTKA